MIGVFFWPSTSFTSPGSARIMSRQRFRSPTVSVHNFKSQILKLSVSNPKSKYVAYLSVLSQISNCQGLGRKNKHAILKTDRTKGRMYVHMYMYAYVYACYTCSYGYTHTFSLGSGRLREARFLQGYGFRRRENMVGVNMLLAEYHQIQTWLL